MIEENIYSVFPSANYKRTRKLAKKRGLDMDLLDWGIDQLARDVLYIVLIFLILATLQFFHTLFSDVFCLS